MDVGQGTQDIGFRNDAPVLFRIGRSSEVRLSITDERGRPTTASLVIKDAQGRLYPTPGKRLAPDFDFQPQVYRADGDVLRLAPGSYTVDLTRGPEYLAQQVPLEVTAAGGTVALKLQRWIDMPARGWYPGDHHIHSAGCLHYETPTQGVEPRDMIRHILGEALSVGSVLTWGPGYYYQKQFFEGRDNTLSTPENLMRYDLEVSGFPSSHAGHLVLLRLKDQDYPGTRTIEDWPTWDLPVLKWAKEQGAVVGFAHSGWGLQVKGNTLPTNEVPPYDGIGANEYVMDVAHDAVDFISTIDTPAIWELNMWYHTLNVGFRTRISGETDFPCIYGDRVGLGRSYVRLDRLSYDAWTQGIRDGRAYVSDGKSHLIDFRVDDRHVGTEGSELRLAQPGTVQVRALVAARLDERSDGVIRGRRLDEKPYWDLERARVGSGREVPLELILNGLARGGSQYRRRRHPAGSQLCAPHRAQQLGSAAHPALVAYQPDFRYRRRRSDPRLARQRRMVPQVDRSVCGRRNRRASLPASVTPPPPRTITRARSTASASPRQPEHPAERHRAVEGAQRQETMHKPLGVTDGDRLRR